MNRTPSPLVITGDIKLRSMSWDLFKVWDIVMLNRGNKKKEIQSVISWEKYKYWLMIGSEIRYFKQKDLVEIK